jgi:dipeptidyl aminopeptidase/acylaminoacyl peptidase
VPLAEPLVAPDRRIGVLEGRPWEKGRSALLILDTDGEHELTPAPFNVRSRVHEYGGGAWTFAGDAVIASNAVDNRLYRIADGVTTAITPEAAWRFADLTFDATTGRLLAIREDHRFPDAEPINTLVMLDPAGPNTDGGRVLVSGVDFVSSPAVAPDGTRIAWVSWNHPNMPWDDTVLSVATLGDDGALTDIRIVAGGRDESVMQPGFLADGRLVFISDRTGWWNLHVADHDGMVTALAPREAEFGTPAWQFGNRDWVVVDDSTIAATWWHEGIAHLGALDIPSRTLTAIELPFTVIGSLAAIPGTRSVVARVASPTLASRIVSIDLDGGETTLLRGGGNEPDPATVSMPEPMSYPTPDGATAHAFFYPPVNPAVVAPEDERPPLIVISHGGPTGATDTGYSSKTQFWTSRGYALLDVNYGGSTGYGRAYRNRLRGRWGIVDVADCVAGVEALIAAGRVDPDRVIIRGGSAGGYTTLQALVTTSTFRIGTSYYGIGDLEMLATDTHKFESRYLDLIVGPYPEAKSVYIERSPIHHVDRLASAMLILQGSDDMVVPPNQATAMADAVRAKGLPLAHIEFEGEGHGFRGSDAQRRSLEAEVAFYSRIFGIEPADDLPDLPIENLA